MGIDNIPSKALKALGPVALSRITALLNEIYDQGIRPEELLKTILLPLPKKKNARTCEEFRKISFICHFTKAMSTIVFKRIKSKIERHIDDDQFGFRKGRGTRDAIACLRLITEMLDVNRKMNVFFIDWQSAFDQIDWNTLMRILKEIELHWRQTGQTGD